MQGRRLFWDEVFIHTWGEYCWWYHMISSLPSSLIFGTTNPLMASNDTSSLRCQGANLQSGLSHCFLSVCCAVYDSIIHCTTLVVRLACLTYIELYFGHILNMIIDSFAPGYFNYVQYVACMGSDYWSPCPLWSNPCVVHGYFKQSTSQPPLFHFSLTVHVVFSCV